MIRWLRWTGWLLSLTVLAAPAAAQDSAAVRTARISYLTGTSAYVDAGRLDGLREAARVEVVRGGAIIGVLRVAYLASHRASCDIISTTAPLVVGDAVRFVAAPAARDSSVAARTPRATARPDTGRSRPALRGRVGVEYFATWQRSATTGRLTEPALQLRLDGPPMGAPALNLAVDVRARGTRTLLPDGSVVSDDRNRVYQAALALNTPGSPARITVGRQISGNLASIGLFDGVLAELHQADWSSGVFTGSQPEPLQLGWSGSVFELGGYTQRHSEPGARTQWALTLGASGSYEAAHVNREFAFFQGSFSNQRVSTFLTQEVDYYRAWKLLPGMQTISPTSTFAIAKYRVTERVTLDAGFDNRRNVRLYQDVTNPETAFDATFREGAWVGAWVQVTRPLRLGFDARSSAGGPAGHAAAYTVSLGADRVTRLGLSVRTRTTRYTNPVLKGWLQSVALSGEPNLWTHVELNGGVRLEQDPLAVPSSFDVGWLGANLDVTVARAWYLLFSATRQRGGADSYDQVYGGLSFRF
jgi:hypothetical protein